MPQYVLEGDGEVQVVAGALTIRTDVLRSTGVAEVDFLVDGAPSRETRKPRPGLLVVPRVGETGILRISPSGSATFPPHSVVSLTIEVNEGRPDSEQILLSNVDVSGLPSRELVALSLVSGRISVRASLMRPDDALSDVAILARVAAREALGVDRVDPALARNIVIAVDGSASFASRTRDGSVPLLLDVLLGLSQVIAFGRSVDVALAADHVRWSTADSAAEQPAALAALQGSTDLSTGTALADPVLRSRRPGEASTLFALTDGIPDESTWPTVAPGDATNVHLILVGDATAVAMYPPTAAPSSAVEPVSAGVDLETRIRHDPGFLRDLVVSLLGGFIPGDSEPARKVSR